MSWDVIIVNSTKEYTMEEIREEDNSIPPFGTRKQMQEKISALFPEINWGDPAYASLDNDIYLGHISLGGDEEPHSTFMLHVYGGTDPLKLVSALCTTYGWSAYDTVTEKSIDPLNPSKAGWNYFLDMRQRIAAQLGGEQGQGMPVKAGKKRWWQFPN